ncbi:hypothetical protein Smp_020360 [Schistosoma mansoni]|uniref:hypothetical protein n=1 Tax=Schistosoma mansoni TaxID=6183 RepID=UPI0001A632C9|nr:hypothetical protein Smp_020360 [Schistosoma mansoni]|eukprot:XP_018647943.1 hypothetical protein Smp_020360 [Schistosoma mansoni]
MPILFVTSYTQTSKLSQFSALSVTFVVISLHGKSHLLLFTVFTVVFTTPFCWLHLYLVIRYFAVYHSSLKCCIGIFFFHFLLRAFNDTLVITHTIDVMLTVRLVIV